MRSKRILQEQLGYIRKLPVVREGVFVPVGKLEKQSLPYLTPFETEQSRESTTAYNKKEDSIPFEDLFVAWAKRKESTAESIKET